MIDVRCSAEAWLRNDAVLVETVTKKERGPIRGRVHYSSLKWSNSRVYATSSFLRRRRAAPARLAIPVPNSTIVAGSGTEVVFGTQSG